MSLDAPEAVPWVLGRRSARADKRWRDDLCADPLSRSRATPCVHVGATRDGSAPRSRLVHSDYRSVVQVYSDGHIVGRCYRVLGFPPEPIRAWCYVREHAASALADFHRRDGVKRLMRAHGICGAKRRAKPWRTTSSDPSAERSPDLVGRDFRASRPDTLWLADFTYLSCWQGVVFFSFVIDAFSRRIVGWQFTSHMRTDLVLDALRMALTRRDTGADVNSCITQTPAAKADSIGRRNTS